ncbi:NADH-quinone oxidoreductase subunit N [soil metagenome]
MKVILLLSGLGLLVLFSELFRFKKVLYPLIVIGLLGAIAVAVSYWYYDDGSLAPFLNGMVGMISDGHGNVVSNHIIPTGAEVGTGHVFFQMISFDSFAILISVIMLTTTLLWFIMAKGFFGDENNSTDHYALIIFALIGAIILTCYSNMVMLFLGIEILSIPLYVLAGSRKNDPASNESAFKYFLMGSFASGFLLFGITLIYGATGSFDLLTIGNFINSHVDGTHTFVYAGILMMLVGLLFKIGAAPFHFWAPDVYEGAPTNVTAFMSTVVKTAAIVAISRLFLTTVFAGVDTFWVPVISVCVGLTFVIGNITAAVQDNVKRMLAYSSISHAGFLLLAIVAHRSGFSAKSIIFYTAAYSVGSITAFTVLLNIMKQTGSDAIENFNGLGKKNPLLAVAMTIALLSLAGIPPTAGFFGKYYVFNAAIAGGHYWLVLIGILASLVGVYYYFRIIIAMFFKKALNDNPITASGQHQALLFITAVIILVLGLMPDLILEIGSSVPDPNAVIQIHP